MPISCMKIQGGVSFGETSPQQDPDNCLSWLDSHAPYPKQDCRTDNKRVSDPADQQLFSVVVAERVCT